MTEYIAIPDAEIANGSALKAGTGAKLRNNAIAIAEGATDAPAVSSRALSPHVMRFPAGGGSIDVTDIPSLKLIWTGWLNYTGTAGPKYVTLGFRKSGAGSDFQSINIMGVSNNSSGVSSGYMTIDLVTGDYSLSSLNAGIGGTGRENSESDTLTGFDDTVTQVTVYDASSVAAFYIVAEATKGFTE